ncbi:MAG TPA: hypothetical protein VE007_05395 [Thermoanaerobaculia bacterium]|nr:hypothetical protein [Thermoanaerobaculia bacterium]
MKSFRDVRIVAVLFLLTGVAAIAQVIVTRSLAISTQMLAIPIGVGLLRYRNAWRVAALVLLWFSLAIVTFVVGIALLNRNLSFGGFLARSPALAGAFLGLSFALTIWEIRVLTRPDVRRSFELGAPA